MSKAVSLLTKRVGKINPQSVEDYVSMGGFEGLKKALTMEPMAIIDEMLDATLLGRGGAAYPAGKKWKQLYNIEGSPKYIVCNGDEGEPGTFKDKILLRDDPMSVIEGMAIAGYVFGANDGYIYIRGEYRLIQAAFKESIEACKKAGFLGENILGSGWNYDIHVVSGAGAYVCGENSALLNSIEAQTGRPRIKPPHLAEVGLFSKPTLVNNVESFADIPLIVNMGGKAFYELGSEGDGGTKLVSICGNVNNRVVAEVGLGHVTLRDLIYDEEFGGGIPEGKELKFFHMGGQSGPIGFPEQLDTPYTAKALKKEGLSIGSGALVVLDEDMCIIDYLLKVCEFFIHESCGKCVPCREGNKQVHNILTKFKNGVATEADLELLQRLSRTMTTASFCGLGQAACTALDCCIKHRRAEFEAHMRGECPHCFPKE